jgi:L-rhamnose mutarotase
MIIRKLIKQRLKPECIDEYIKAHNEIWQELVDEYKNGGITQCSCFLDGTDLYVLMEYDDQKQIANKIDPKWQEYMNTLKDMTANSIEINEIFRMEI